MSTELSGRGDGRKREAAVRQACFDPGAWVERERTPSDFGGTDLEPLHAWQARAVLAALEAVDAD